MEAGLGWDGGGSMGICCNDDMNDNYTDNGNGKANDNNNDNNMIILTTLTND